MINKVNSFTQSEEQRVYLKVKNKDGNMISKRKVVRQSTIKPQTFRGGGFLYFSKSIEGEEGSNNQKPSYYEDHAWLVQSPKAHGQLMLQHPKMKGDNVVHSVREDHGLRKKPFKIHRMVSDLKHSESVNSFGTKKEPFVMNSLFSKDSVQIEEIDSNLHHGASSSRSSNIQIDKFYVRVW